MKKFTTKIIAIALSISMILGMNVVSFAAGPTDYPYGSDEWYEWLRANVDRPEDYIKYWGGEFNYNLYNAPIYRVDDMDGIIPETSNPRYDYIDEILKKWNIKYFQAGNHNVRVSDFNDAVELVDSAFTKVGKDTLSHFTQFSPIVIRYIYTNDITNKYTCEWYNKTHVRSTYKVERPYEDWRVFQIDITEDNVTKLTERDVLKGLSEGLIHMMEYKLNMGWNIEEDWQNPNPNFYPEYLTHKNGKRQIFDPFVIDILQPTLTAAICEDPPAPIGSYEWKNANVLYNNALKTFGADNSVVLKLKKYASVA